MWKFYLFLGFIIAFLFIFAFAVIEDTVEEKKWREYLDGYEDGKQSVLKDKEEMSD